MISKVNDFNRRRNHPYIKKRRTKAPSNSGARSFLNVVVVSLAIILVSVIAVRAYLTAETEKKKNAFASAEMTYTDTDTVEPNGKAYTIQIDNDTKVGTLKSSGNDKSAYVHNSEGADKKPVFVRVTMVMNIYDSSGVNVTREYSDCAPDYHHSDNSEWSADWVIDTVHTQPVRYYYKHVLLPGDDTSYLFDSVTIANADKLPQNATVKIRVVTDTVQAVSTDDMDWTEADYTNSEVAKVWNVTASVVTSGQNAGQVTWTFS